MGVFKVRVPKNIILHPGSNCQDKGDSRNHCSQDPSDYVGASKRMGLL